MARSHHRKKHKAHLKQFKHSHDTTVSPNARGKSLPIFVIGAAVAGFAIGYFASNGSPIWMALTTLIGTCAGYFIGRKMDKE